MSVVLITSVSPSRNLVTTRDVKKSNLFRYNSDNNTTNTTTNNDIEMTKNLINNGQISSSMGNIEYINNFETFKDRTYDDNKSSYQYNNFTNHNINKVVTEKNANENLDLKNNANLISIHENSIYTTSSSLSSSLFSSFLSSSPESNVNNIISNINMQHITTSTQDTLNTVKKPFTTGGNNSDSDSEIVDTTLNNDNNDIKNSPKPLKPLKSSFILANKPQFKSNDADRVITTSDDNLIKKSQPFLKQPSPSKYQRLKRTLSLRKKSDREEEQQQQEVIDTSDNSFSLFATTTPHSSLKENYQYLPMGSSVIAMSVTTVKNDDLVDNNNIKSSFSPSPLRRFSRSVTKNKSNDAFTQQSENFPSCIYNNTRKRVKSNCTFSSTSTSTSSSSSSLVENSSEDSFTCSSPTSSISVCDSVIQESRDHTMDTAKIKCRNSMDDQSDFDIRRSWSHIEVRHFKGLFKRNRHSSDVQRRNSYAYTSSPRTNLQMASESEFKVLNHVHNVNNNNINESSTTASNVEQSPPKKFPVDIFALQANEEKETDVLTRLRQMRKFIISEIYSTEQSYLCHMKTLKKTFMDPCIASTSSPLINKDDIRTIFAHLDDLIKLSDTIVETLETSMDPWEVYDSKLGHVFLRFAEGFEVYKKYAENIQRSRQLLSKKVNQSVFYRRFVSSQRKKENIKLGLNDYMIMPIQRVARYALLLKDLKKYTVETHSDYNDLCKALDNMVALATECNDNVQVI